jgi:glycine/D-amino acid oxidase-like deaminating enzyme
VYDTIIVGARCAGSPLAMLLARKGYKVLLADKASFPSDIISTHYIHQPGIAPTHAIGPARRRQLLQLSTDSGLAVRPRSVRVGGVAAVSGWCERSLMSAPHGARQNPA